MERAPVQFRFHMPNKGPPNSPSRQQRQNNDRGRYDPSNRYDRHPGVGLGGSVEYGGAVGRGGGRGGRRPSPVKFVRNPKHPKNLFDTEISLRKIAKDKPIKLTPGLSFPDPKGHKSISNPKAPRFHHEFDPSPDDYNIIHNPLVGIDKENDDRDGRGLMLSRYIRNIDYASSDGTDDVDDVDRHLVIHDDDAAQTDDDDEGTRDNDTEVMMQAQEEEEYTLYLQENKLRAHRVREGQLLDAEPPAFEPQPPPPRAPIDPVLVIPRAMVREEEQHREHRHRDQAKNGAYTLDDNNNFTD